jgi:DNA repair protein SbcD/Mre11
MYMIRITFLSDTHLGFDLPLRARSERRRRGEDFFRNTRTAFEQAIKHESDYIIHGGDLFFRSRVPAPIIDRVYAMLYDYADCGIPIIIVPGNHERSVLPQSILLNHPNLFIFRKAESFEFTTRHKKVLIFGYPNLRHHARAGFSCLQPQILPTPGALNILVMHQAIDGSKIAGYTFRDHPDVVNISEIDTGYQLVLCGHIHRRQILMRQHTPIIYSGSIERTSFQEMGEPKGYYTIDMQQSNTNWRVKKIIFNQLNSRPMTEICLDMAAIQNEWETELIAQLQNLDPNSIVRLRAKNNREDFIFRAERLRAIFPPTMNYSLTRSLFSGKVREK